jgi:hypothetical protein
MTRTRILSLAATLTLTLLVGQMTDRTTGQPLRGVQITVLSGGRVLRAATGADGRFRLPGLQPGPRTLHYSSADVPPQSLKLTVHGARQSIAITACSTTLDYSCETGGGS